MIHTRPTLSIVSATDRHSSKMGSKRKAEFALGDPHELPTKIAQGNKCKRQKRSYWKWEIVAKETEKADFKQQKRSRGTQTQQPSSHTVSTQSSSALILPPGKKPILLTDKIPRPPRPAWHRFRARLHDLGLTMDGIQNVDRLLAGMERLDMLQSFSEKDLLEIKAAIPVQRDPAVWDKLDLPFTPEESKALQPCGLCDQPTDTEFGHGGPCDDCGTVLCR